MHIGIVLGNIAEQRCDAIITTVSPQGMWDGPVDLAIKKAAGSIFHGQIPSGSPLRHGTTVVTKNSIQADNNGGFEKVIFVIDEGIGTLWNLILNGLTAADAEGCLSVAIPALRMEIDPSAAQDIARGVRSFVDKLPQSSVHLIRFVVGANTTHRDKLMQTFGMRSIRL